MAACAANIPTPLRAAESTRKAGGAGTRPRSPKAALDINEEPLKRARGQGDVLSGSPTMVVLLSGEPVDISPAPAPAEAVFDLRGRVAVALSLDVGRVMLVAGKEILEDSRLVGDVRGVSSITAMVLDDLMDLDDPQHVSEYAPDIFRRLLEEDPRRALEPAPDARAESDARLRRSLVDWLVEVHSTFGMTAETLFLTVSIVDRFLKARPTVEDDLRLVGVTCMLIAAKFEEIYPPELRDFVYSLQNACTVDDIRTMEAFILSILGFAISVQTPLHFMDRCQRANHCSDQHGCLVQYILELALTDATAARSAPCRLAAAATLLSNRLLERRPVWPLTMIGYTGCTEDALAEPAEHLHELLRNARHSAFQQVRRKFSRAEHFGVVRLVEEAL